MSRIPVGVCPALEELLLAEDGELPPQAQAAIAAHRAQCLTCQSALFAVAGLLRMIGHVTKHLGENESGSTDAAEARFRRFLVKLDARKQQQIHKRSAGIPVRRWLAIAALPFFVACFVVIELRPTVIEADELVKFAAHAESTRPPGMSQRVRIKLGHSNHFAMSGVGVPDFTHEYVLSDDIVTTSAPVALEGRAASIAQVLADHRFTWQRLLSAREFNAWRNALPHRHDEVIPLRGTPHVALRTTTTDDGDLREVELTVERDTYRVVGESFVFETIGKLEIEQTEQWVKRAAPAAATVVASAATRPTRPAPERVSPLGTVQTAPQPDLTRWLDRRFGNTTARTEFMPELRRLTGAVRQRLDSLQDLSSRYPGSDGPQASPSARARLQRERDLQYRSLREDLDALYARILTLTLQPNGVARRPMATASRQPHAPEDWSRRVDTARPQAITLDRLAGELRAYDDLPAPVSQRLADTFDALWSAIYAP